MTFPRYLIYFFFFNDTATTEIYTLSLHDALPISPAPMGEDEQVTEGGQQIPRRVTLLQQTRHHAAQSDRHLLHYQRRAHAPFRPHADPEQRAQHEKRDIVRRESG